MRAARLATYLLVVSAIAHGQVAKAARRPSAVPFDSFRSIDQKLSLLDAQLSRIDSLLQKAASGAIATSSGTRSRQPWSATSQQMLTNVRSLGKTAAGLQRQYSKSVVARSLFPPLLKSATALEKAATALAASKNVAQTKSGLEEVQKSRIDFVLSFHAISADYGALRCERGRWACCEVASQNGSASCRWSCVQSTRQCSKGLLGPRSQSASAEVVRH
jgi:hypothetical protein